MNRAAFELHDGIAVSAVDGREVTLHVTVGPTSTGREPVCVVIVTYDVDVGWPNVVGLLESWDDDGRPAVLSDVPTAIEDWVFDSREVVNAAEDAWASHVQDCRDDAVESGYCGARGM